MPILPFSPPCIERGVFLLLPYELSLATNEHFFNIKCGKNSHHCEYVNIGQKSLSVSRSFKEELMQRLKVINPF